MEKINKDIEMPASIVYEEIDAEIEEVSKLEELEEHGKKMKQVMDDFTDWLDDISVI